MASGSSQSSGRASKTPSRSAFVDPDYLLISGDREEGVESLSALDRRDNDPELDDPLQVIFDSQARLEEESEEDSEASEEERYKYILFRAKRRAAACRSINGQFSQSVLCFIRMRRVGNSAPSAPSMATLLAYGGKIEP